MPKSEKGFTLIELLVVVLIVSTLFGLSIPGYRQYVLRSGRADAVNALLRVAAAQERFYLQNGIYATNAQMQAVPPAGLGFTTAASERGYYDLAITPDAAGLTIGYMVTASVDASDKQKDDTACVSMSVDQNGRRGVNGGYVPADVEKCWR